MATRRRTTRALTFQKVCELAAAFPGVETGTSYGTPALRMRGTLLARLQEDGETMMLRVGFVVRDHLLATSPESFYITNHYRDYPALLVRLGVAERAVVEQLLEDAWRAAAPKRIVQTFDARAGSNLRQRGAQQWEYSGTSISRARSRTTRSAPRRRMCVWSGSSRTSNV